MSFHEYSKEILTEYLGTVAYVDDLIFNKKEELKAFNLGKVSTREMAAKTPEEKIAPKENPEGEKVYKDPEVKKEQLNPNINPSAFTNAFLAKGIHCSLFEIENEDDSLEPLKKILRKSDVVILDWQMHQDNGRKAYELLESVIESPGKPELRLFIIFTNDPQYKNLLSQIILPKLKEKDIINEIPENIECVFKFGHSKIVVLEKMNGKASDTAVSDEDLPNRIIDEFIEITSGLVSNTILKAISVIRRNTHSLLGVFNKNLDAAYLAHRAMLLTPEDSELLLKSTIIDSFDSLLTYSQINLVNNIEQIEKWVDESDLPADLPHIVIGKGDKKLDIEVNKENRKKWLKVGWKKLIQDQPENQLLESHYESFEKGNGPLFLASMKSFVPDGNFASQDFAILTHHKSNFTTPTYIPFLSLGVVVQNGDDYLLCIQQKCDSVRIEQDETRNFLFLPLTQKGSYPIVFKNKHGEYIVRKATLNKCHNLSIIKFRQTNHGIVEADNENGVFIFSSIDGSKFEWVLDLKDSHSQRIANKFAAELSRVGLDESEWLRRYNS